MKNTSHNQMFSVTCMVTGNAVKVRMPVYLKRVEKVQKLVRTTLGSPCSKEEAKAVLNARYVSNAGRKSAGVDFLNQPLNPVITEEAVITPVTEVI